MHATPLFERKVGKGDYILIARVPGHMGARQRTGFDNSPDAVTHARRRLGATKFMVYRGSDGTITHEEGN